MERHQPEIEEEATPSLSCCPREDGLSPSHGSQRRQGEGDYQPMSASVTPMNITVMTSCTLGDDLGGYMHS